MTIHHYPASRRYASSLERPAPRSAALIFGIGAGVILSCALLAAAAFIWS